MSQRALLLAALFVAGRLAASTFTITDLGTLEGNYSAATALNASGQVVGISNLGNGSYSGFFYAGTMHALAGWRAANISSPWPPA
jgi:probable HAF family extracellular repeat protein